MDVTQAQNLEMEKYRGQEIITDRNNFHTVCSLAYHDSHWGPPNWTSCYKLLISAPSLGVYYCQQLTLCSDIPVCLSRSFKLLLFCFSMELSHFWPSVLHVALYKSFSSIFDSGPLNPKIYCPKFGTKSPISRLEWQIDRKCLGLLGGFRG